MMRKIYFLIFFAAIFVAASCSSSRTGGNFTVYDKSAMACYYANKFNGRKTASGEKFSNSKLTAAHRKLPFGTKAKVTNLANGRHVIVIINDRGPFSGGNDIDLSKKAFMEITDNKNHGRLRVKIEIAK